MTFFICDRLRSRRHRTFTLRYYSHVVRVPTFCQNTVMEKVRWKMKPATKPTVQGERLAAAAEESTGSITRWFARRLRTRPQDVADLLQEVKLRLLHVSDDLLLRQPAAYIYRVAYSVLVQYTRDRSEEHHLRLDSEDLVNEEALGSGPEGDPAYRFQMRAEIDRALDQLPAKHRNVLLLHKRDGYSHQETAQKLGLTEHQVHRYLTQAKAQLQTLLWPDGEAP